MNDPIRGVLSAFALPCPVADEALTGLEAYFALRARWATAHNLSGPRALRDPAGTDLGDAAALACLAVPVLPVVDVGAGSGVPGVLLALLRRDLAVACVEPAAKRAAFLRQVAGSLALPHLAIRRETWPCALSAPAQVVSRAVFPVVDWPARAAEGGPCVRVFFRYLARERPEVPDALGFVLDGALDYEGPDASAHRLERWRRFSP